MAQCGWLGGTDWSLGMKIIEGDLQRSDVPKFSLTMIPIFGRCAAASAGMAHSLQES